MFLFLKSSVEALHVSAEARFAVRETRSRRASSNQFMEAKNASLASVSLALWVVVAEEHASLYIALWHHRWFVEQSADYGWWDRC